MRKHLFITVVVALLLTTCFTFADSQQKVVVDKALIDSGIIKVSYNSGNYKTARILIEKETKKYNYSLKSDGTIESFPLQMGNGDYNISILENISGNKYSYVHRETIKLNISNQNKVFLGSVQNVSWNETMMAIKKAKELTKNIKTDKEKITVVYNYIVSNYKYDFSKLKNLPTDYIPVIDKTLEEGKGICYDYSSLFASMLRSAGIPVRLIKGYTDNVEGYHAWNEIYMSDTAKWVPIDSTFDAQMKAANRKYTMLKSITLYRLVNLY
jgi:transglutaminase-like putative cysteine protease